MQSIRAKKTPAIKIVPLLESHLYIKKPKQNTQQCATALPAGSAKVAPSPSYNPKPHCLALNPSVSSHSDSLPTQKTATRQQHSMASMSVFQEAILSSSEFCRHVGIQPKTSTPLTDLKVVTATFQAATSQNPPYSIVSQSLKLPAMDMRSV